MWYCAHCKWPNNGHEGSCTFCEILNRNSVSQVLENEEMRQRVREDLNIHPMVKLCN